MMQSFSKLRFFLVVIQVLPFRTINDKSEGTVGFFLNSYHGVYIFGAHVQT